MSICREWRRWTKRRKGRKRGASELSREAFSGRRGEAYAPVVVAGNWKMHHGPQATRAFFTSFRPSLAQDGLVPRLLLFPPFLSLAAAVAARPPKPWVDFGVQDLFWEREGAFTGEVSASMAREAGARFALVGHSERRRLFGETDAWVERKARAALAEGLGVVVCVGETWEERRAGRVEDVLLAQMAALGGVLEEFRDAEIFLAYEPVWAIGTGETASPEDASQAHGILRRSLAQRMGWGRARSLPILYGGSVRPDNALELLSAPEVDGLLVGGASLDPRSFSLIAEAGAQALRTRSRG